MSVEAELQELAGALNQAVKAVAIARGFVAPSGLDLICIPAFTDIEIDGEERTAIKLIVELRGEGALPDWEGLFNVVLRQNCFFRPSQRGGLLPNRWTGTLFGCCFVRG